MMWCDFFVGDIPLQLKKKWLGDARTIMQAPWNHQMPGMFRRSWSPRCLFAASLAVGQRLVRGDMSAVGAALVRLLVNPFNWVVYMNLVFIWTVISKCEYASKQHIYIYIYIQINIYIYTYNIYIYICVCVWTYMHMHKLLLLMIFPQSRSPTSV